MTDNQRIKSVVDYLKKEKKIRNQRDFVERIGGNYSVVSEIISGKRKVSERFVGTICETFPFISHDWIINEEGEMIIEVPALENDESDLKKLIDANASLAASVAKLAETNSKLAEKILELSDTNAKGAVVRMEENAGCAVAK